MQITEHVQSDSMLTVRILILMCVIIALKEIEHMWALTV